MKTNMKGLGIIDKLVFFFNSVAALCLLLSLLTPYLPPENYPFLSLLSLVVSPLLFLQVLFFVYWLLRVKKQMLLPLVVLVLCFVQFNSFYRLDFMDKPEALEKQLQVMSYNVRLFNRYQWLPQQDIPQKITRFLNEHNPDVVSFQEFSFTDGIDLGMYPHQYVKLKKQNPSFGQAIYSKYPIVKEGSLDFANTSNNAIYVDIVKEQDTIRVFNLHLESLQLHPEDVDFKQEASQRLARRMANAFKVQQRQLIQLKDALEQTPYKTIVTADLNNTAFSYVYNKLKADKNDAFAEAGKGLGKTFTFKEIPLRIDFILTDPRFVVNGFTTHPVDYSDHHPISTKLSW